MILKEKDLQFVKEIVRKKLGVVREIFLVNHNYTEARLYLQIKSELKDTIKSIPELNSYSITLTKSILNHKNRIEPSDEFISLKQFEKLSGIRPSVAKKMLIKQGYFIGNHPTNKSYRLNCVFTRLHKFKVTAMKCRTETILTLWREKFLFGLLKKYKSEFLTLNEVFTFHKARSERECFNQIQRHYEALIGKPLGRYYNIESIIFMIDSLLKKELNDRPATYKPRLEVLRKYLVYYQAKF